MIGWFSVFRAEVLGQIFAMILEPFFLSNVAELTCEDPEFERFLLRARGSDAIL